MNFLYVFDFVNILHVTQENFSEIFFNLQRKYCTDFKFPKDF